MSGRYHNRKGKFGKKDQHMERKLLGYLSDICDYAGGMMQGVHRFTSEEDTLDTEKIKKTVSRILETYGEIPNDMQRELYLAFFYCAFVLSSVEYRYFDRHSGLREGWHFVYPPIEKKKFPVRMVAEIPDSKIWSEFYKLLTGEEIQICYEPDFDDFVSDSISDESEMNEFNRYIDRINAQICGNDTNEISRENEETGSEMENAEAVSYKKKKKWSMAESGSIKAYYPGYMDFVDYTRAYNELSKKCHISDFKDRVRRMLEYYVLSEGNSLYSDEKQYLEVMVQLNRTRKLLKKYMGGNS